MNTVLNVGLGYNVKDEIGNSLNPILSIVIQSEVSEPQPLLTTRLYCPLVVF